MIVINRSPPNKQIEFETQVRFGTFRRFFVRFYKTIFFYQQLGMISIMFQRPNTSTTFSLLIFVHVQIECATEKTVGI